MKNITQEDYERFYKDILIYVYGLPHGKQRLSYKLWSHIEKTYMDKIMGLNYCSRPSPEDEKVYNITSQISLSERKYGRFIDNYFKEAYARYLIKGDTSGIEEMKSDIAFVIRELFEDSRQLKEDSKEMEMIRDYFNVK